MQKILPWQSPLIRDGFTARAYIKEVEGLHGEIRFSYRPMLPETADEIEAQRRKMSGAKDTQMIAKAIVERLVGWDLKHGNEPDPINLENVRRLKWNAFYKMYNIISGSVASDLDPTWDDAADGLLPPLETSIMEQLKN